MKMLDKTQFNDRLQAILKARKIFVPHITRNISVAFELYQELLADQERELFIKSSNIPTNYKILDKYERPICENCGSPLGLRPINIPKGKENKFGYKLCWECLKCGYEAYKQNTIDEEMKNLKIKD